MLTKEKVSTNGYKPNEPVQLRRLGTVPDASLATKYIHRQVEGLQDFAMFDLAYQEGWNVLLEGDTGTGKTMAAMAYASSEGFHFYSTPSNVGIDPAQLLGKFIPDETGTSIGVWQDGGVTDMVRYGGVLLINEVNFLPARVATAIFSLLDARREITLLDNKGEVIRAHLGKEKCWCGTDCDTKRLLIIGDMNPGYVGTSELNQAFRNRFELQVDWGYDPTVEKTLIESPELRTLAAQLRKARHDGNITTPTSTNMLIEFEKLVSKVGLKFATSNLVQHFEVDDRAAVTNVLRTVEANLNASYKRIAEAKRAETVKKEAPKKPTTGDWDFIDSENVQGWLNSI